MSFPVYPFACKENPNSEACKKAKKFFGNLLKAACLAKFIKYPPVRLREPLAGEAYFEEDINSELPSIPEIINNQNRLIGEILSHALGEPSPQSSSASLVGEIELPGVQLEIFQGLIHQFTLVTEALEEEAE